MSSINDDTFTIEQKNVIFYVTRILTGVTLIPFIIIIIVYINNRKNFTTIMWFNLQLCISQLLGNSNNCFPMIYSEKLEKSFVCKSQVIITYISAFSRSILIFGIILSSYFNFSKKRETKCQKYNCLIISIICWIVSISFALCYLMTELKSSPTGYCKANGKTMSFVYYGYLIVMSVAINILIIMMLIEMKKQMNTSTEDKKDCYKLTRHFLFFNIPIFLQLCVIALKSLPYFGLTSPFYLSLIVEIIRILVRCLIVVIICYNKTIVKEFINIIMCKKIDPSDPSAQSTELFEEINYNGLISEL